MKQTRRDFLKTAGCALSMTALATQAENFGLMTALASKAGRDDAAPPTDYKALVCIFLIGGNDGNNTIIPAHNDANVSNYAAYSAARSSQGLALAQTSLLPIGVPRIGNLNYGLHPNFGTVAGQLNTGLHPLWAQGKMAAVTNIGTLVQPITRQQFQTNALPRPFNLFSHTDQTNQHQTARSNMVSLSGWGGRISDKITNTANPTRLVPTITTLAGTQVFTAGENTQPVAISPAPTPLGNVLALVGYNNTPVTNARLEALNQGMDIDNGFQVVAASNAINKQAVEISRSLGNGAEVTVIFPDTTLGNQLKQVARLVKSRVALSVNRQIFFCTLGGFDTHAGQLNNQGNLFTQFSQATRAFYEEMLVQGMQNQVTQFTLSDFSRTFNPAGSGANVGSDHAWANHTFVIGGAVQGGNFYGMNTSNGTPFPTLERNGPDDSDSGTTARGRWIPTTSVEQYAATLSSWFGLPEADMGYVFPNLANFPTRNLGFMLP